MERQVVLAGKNRHYNQKKVDNEIITINKLLPFIESFKAFHDNNEVFDVSKKCVVRSRRRLFKLYRYGCNDSPFLYMLSKN